MWLCIKKPTQLKNGWKNWIHIFSSFFPQYTHWPHTDGQQTHGKMLNITNRQRNASQNYNEVSPHTSQNGHIQKSTNNTFWRGCGGKGTILHCWRECNLVQPLWRTVWKFLKKLKIELPQDPEIPLLGIYLEKTMVQKDPHTPVFITAPFTIVRTWKPPKCPSTDEWIKKMWYNWILSSH